MKMLVIMLVGATGALGLSQGSDETPRTRVAVARIECPMPVAPVNPGIDRMPSAGITPQPGAIQVVRPGCVNPLFRGHDSVAMRRVPVPPLP